jgi:glycosyltransferase involved in cell wall biosynthesis
MRVLYVDHTSLVSGAQRALLDLLAALPDDVEPIVVCPEGQLAELVQGLGVTAISFRGTTGSLRLHPTDSLRVLRDIGRSARRLISISRALDADVIHANSLRAGLIAACTGPMRPPMVLHVHDALPHGLSANAVRLLLRRAAAAVVTISNYTTSNFFGNSERTHAHMLYNPLDLERFDPAVLTRAEARRLSGLQDARGPIMGIVAQITPWKGQEEAIRALALVRRRHPDARLLVVGEAKFVDKATRFDNRAYERQLRELVVSEGLEACVEFLGERDDVPVILRALDVLVAPSWEEPFGRSVIEAMALETPVVATNVGGPSEYIENGIDGILVPAHDPPAVAEATMRLLGDPRLASRIGRRASPKVRALFDRTDYARRMAVLYETVLAGARPCSPYP